MFKSLSDYLKASQQEWRSLFEARTDPETEKQAEYEIGIEEMESGRYENAIAYLKTATSSKKYRKEAYYHLAECYQQLNMIPLARKTYERLMRFDYNYRDVQERIRALDSPGLSDSPMLKSSKSQVSDQKAEAATVIMAGEERYEMLATLHEGRHSRIYRVRDKLLERTIALKQINADYPDRAVYLQQMKERTALAHPNIVRIYDIDELQGQITMEYVDGQNLRHTLRLKGALAPKMIIYLAIQLINGLHQAHNKGIIHHALTPEHILLTRQGHLKIIAFRAPDSFMRLQKTDNPYKYLYIPPEFFQGQALTIASNIYSFGVILYEMFVGRTPFRLQQIKAFIHHEQPLQYDETLLPSEIRLLIQHCLAQKPEQRYANMRAIGEELLGWYKGFERQEAHEDDLAAYKDYLLMAWADGTITPQEADFLTHKQQELHISVAESRQAEEEVKQELKALLCQSNE
ncbi:kinase domain protein [Candidatus Vecturithrix granuli]|uniref:Kinase domain protein n=1 Tax=Vecturithrix granuli TaxID=1499967 RepID=A0A081C1R2_VECG1|nr:kinase domain protein [Candidatus Vecturithrix granuli]